MKRQYEQLRERQEDLNNDLANQYYSDSDYAWQHYNEDDE